MTMTTAVEIRIMVAETKITVETRAMAAAIIPVTTLVVVIPEAAAVPMWMWNGREISCRLYNNLVI